MKTFKLQITEEELVAIIAFNTSELYKQALSPDCPLSTQTAQRIVDLTRRLNKETPDIEGDPRPKHYYQAAADKFNTANGQIEAGKENAKIPEGW